jgi:alpha-amylase
MFYPSAVLQNSNIYEVNLRQYSASGSFKSFTEHLPRLKKLGVQILWFMPIYPIGQKNRKGSLGSYYAVQNYTAVNPEFGSLTDFKVLVNEAHSLGFKVIIDWVANHSSWDNVWTQQENDFYVKDEQGNHQQAFDWEDVIQINHNSVKQQKAMMDAMLFWIKECDIDGFRADLAHLTPLTFWIQARITCAAQKKDLIWLAETEEPSYQQAFDISYTWKWMHAIELFCKGEKSLTEAVAILQETNALFAQQHYRMYFTSNHDENSWNGTAVEKYGALSALVAVFSYTYLSLPLLYSGEEASNTKRLAFFDKDVIDWQTPSEMAALYELLIAFRQQAKVYTTSAYASIFNEALQYNVLAYKVVAGEKAVLVLLNFNLSAVELPSSIFGEDVEKFLQFPSLANFEAKQVSISAKDFLLFITK